MAIGFTKYQIDSAIPGLKRISRLGPAESVRPFVKAILDYLDFQGMEAHLLEESKPPPTNKLPSGVPLFKGEAVCCLDQQLETKIIEDHTNQVACYHSVLQCTNCWKTFVTSVLWKNL